MTDPAPRLRSAKNAVDVGLIASRASDMVAFYRDVVGLEYLESFPSPVGLIHRLQFGASFIKIVVGPAEAAVPAGTSTYADPGLRYLTFETPDIDAAWARAMAAGAPVVIDLQAARGNGPRSGTFRDPEGNLVELLCRA